MTTMPDTERAKVDRTISAWLASRVPESPPPDLMARVVDSTRGRSPRPAWLARWRGHQMASRQIRRRDRSRWLLVIAAVGLGTGLVALAAGRAFDVDRPAVIGPVPSPTADATATSAVSGQLVTYTNIEGGYELLMPAPWQAGPGVKDYSTIHPGVRSFGESGAGKRFPALMISHGQPDGSVTICESGCRTIVVKTLAELEDAVVSTPPGHRCNTNAVDPSAGEGTCSEVRGDLLLDGIPARYEELATKDGRSSKCLGCPSALYHVVAIRNGRPIVIAFNFWNIDFQRTSPDTEGDFGLAARDEMLASFRFLEPPDALTLFRNVEDGYELVMPQLWIGDGTPQPHKVQPGAFPGTRWFGHGSGHATSNMPALTISVGRPDGSIVLCQSVCGSVTVHTIAELAEAVQSTDPSILKRCIDEIACTERRGATALGPTPARFEEFATTDGRPSWCLGCPGALFNVFTMHDGRPVVLAFDYWNIYFGRTGGDIDGEFGPAARDQMLASFRFLD